MAGIAAGKPVMPAAKLHAKLAVVVLIFVIGVSGGSPALAVRPDERLSDPALEARARNLSQELRCLVCQNQSIDDSDADLARDLRLVLRERLQAGDDDRAALAYIAARYGDYVLLSPPIKASTLILWTGPGVILLLGFGGIIWVRRRRPVTALPPLSAAEQARIKSLTAADQGPQ
ncbi:cytochrome c-type biogenesis protein CcmH [Alphaproteobacteria bacterium]|jgi:cytochrome c-type biogenesis protein CcmH|nr:cytochrome c-type biogenesis protein CcmH [Alphaproteobacteria bacterium]